MSFSRRLLTSPGCACSGADAAWSSLCTMSRCTVSEAVAPSVLPYTLPVIRRTMLEVRAL